MRDAEFYFVSGCWVLKQVFCKKKKVSTEYVVTLFKIQSDENKDND